MTYMPAIVDRFLAETCCNCGISFAMTDSYKAQRHEDGKNFYCPNGHPQHYTSSTARKIENLERQRDHAQARARHADDQREAAERSNTALRGHLTRAKRRAAAGVCPCCTEKFANVAEHMRTKHPDFVESAKGGA